MRITLFGVDRAAIMAEGQSIHVQLLFRFLRKLLDSWKLEESNLHRGLLADSIYNLPKFY